MLYTSHNNSRIIRLYEHINSKSIPIPIYFTNAVYFYSPRAFPVNQTHWNDFDAPRAPFKLKWIHFEVLLINTTENQCRIDSKEALSLTSVGAGAALPAHRGLVLSFAEGLQVYRGFPDRGNRLWDAVARVARWIWRGLHVVLSFGAIAAGVSRCAAMRLRAQRFAVAMYFSSRSKKCWTGECRQRWVCRFDCPLAALERSSSAAAQQGHTVNNRWMDVCETY